MLPTLAIPSLTPPDREIARSASAWTACPERVRDASESNGASPPRIHERECIIHTRERCALFPGTCVRRIYE
jgi:hypothetical protein